MVVALRNAAPVMACRKGRHDTLQGACDRSIWISAAHESVRLNRTAPPPAVAQTWKLHLERSIARPWTSDMGSSSNAP